MDVNHQQYDIRIISDLNECRRIWDMLSPKETIYDVWEFRNCFYKYLNYRLFFYTVYLQNVPVGLLPLQLNPETGLLEFFGDHKGWMDQNKIFTTTDNKEALVALLLQNITMPAQLDSLTGHEKIIEQLPITDYTHLLPLSTYSTTTEYTDDRLHGSKKKQIKNIIKTYEDIKLEKRYNVSTDIEHLFELNIQHFGNESSFVWPHRKEIFRDFLQLHCCKSNLTTLLYQDKIIGVCLSLQYRDSYIGINMGVDTNILPDILSYLLLIDIQNAISCGAKQYDARGGNQQGKARWHFDQIPQHSFTYTL